MGNSFGFPMRQIRSARMRNSRRGKSLRDSARAKSARSHSYSFLLGKIILNVLTKLNSDWLKSSCEPFILVLQFSMVSLKKDVRRSRRLRHRRIPAAQTGKCRHPVRRFRNTEAVMMDMRYLKSNLNVSCGCKKDACQGGIRRGI